MAILSTPNVNSTEELTQELKRFRLTSTATDMNHGIDFVPLRRHNTSRI